MYTLRVIMMAHLEAMLKSEALPLFYIKHIFVLKKSHLFAYL